MRIFLLLALSILSIGCSISDKTFKPSLIKAEATLDDFKDYCEASEGKWQGSVTSVISEKNVGQKGALLKYEWEARFAKGGKVMNQRVNGTNSSSEALVFYDAAAKKIQITYASSKGIVNRHSIHRDGDKWIRLTRQARPNGTITSFYSEIRNSSDGKIKTIDIYGKDDNGEEWKQTNVWHKVEE